MKSELYKILSPLERKRLQGLSEYFDQAEHGYVRAMPREDAEFLHQIYHQLSGQSVNLSCGKCVLDVVKYLLPFVKNN